MLDYLTGGSLLIRSLLRLALIALIAALVSTIEVDHWLDEAFATLLTVYAVAATVWMVVLVWLPYRRWFGWASTAVDVVFVLALCITSGALTFWLLPVFLLLPIPGVFLESPVVTAALGLTAASGYLAAWVFSAVRGKMHGLPDAVYVQVGFLLWLTVALTVMSFALRRRSGRVEKLMEVRRRLVAEVMQADARNSRMLSEQLHDGPLQNLLAARFDLVELRRNPSAENIDRIEAALMESVTALRSTVATLHPQVLDDAGLTAAIRALIASHEKRWDVPIDADLDEVDQTAGQEMLYRAAREFLTNAAKHSCASRLRVRLRDNETEDGTGEVTLLVADDGIGFDPEVLTQRVTQGHIGLASLFAGTEAMGGAVQLDTGPGAGTAITVRLPAGRRSQ